MLDLVSAPVDRVQLSAVAVVGLNQVATECPEPVHPAQVDRTASLAEFVVSQSTFPNLAFVVS